MFIQANKDYLPKELFDKNSSQIWPSFVKWDLSHVEADRHAIVALSLPEIHAGAGVNIVLPVIFPSSLVTVPFDVRTKDESDLTIGIEMLLSTIFAVTVQTKDTAPSHFVFKISAIPASDVHEAVRKFWVLVKRERSKRQGRLLRRFIAGLFKREPRLFENFLAFSVDRSITINGGEVQVMKDMPDKLPRSWCREPFTPEELELFPQLNWIGHIVTLTSERLPVQR